MFSDLSDTIQDSYVNYPITDSRLPFQEYIKQCQNLIETRRTNFGSGTISADKIIAANSPFEYTPENHTGKIKHGALLIHGLLDCPFTFRELGEHLKKQGILTRAILLPGHGTRPSDLLTVTYHDWLQAVRYGIESLKKEVDVIHLVGYSTGAALAVYHAMQDHSINSITLLSPAIKVRAPVDIIASWYYLINYPGKKRHWVYYCDEEDYVKYKSIAFNGVRQVTKLTDAIREMRAENPLTAPMYMIISREDETISSHDAIDFFTSQHHQESRMLLYTSSDYKYFDPRIQPRKSTYPEMNITHISHPALSFSPDNPHYGQNGDYKYASRRDNNYIYGAYNRIEINAFEMMLKCRLAKAPRRVLTYNPDFHYMANSISEFITGSKLIK